MKKVLGEVDVIFWKNDIKQNVGGGGSLSGHPSLPSFQTKNKNIICKTHSNYGPLLFAERTTAIRNIEKKFGQMQFPICGSPLYGAADNPYFPDTQLFSILFTHLAQTVGNRDFLSQMWKHKTVFTPIPRFQRVSKKYRSNRGGKEEDLRIDKNLCVL